MLIINIKMKKNTKRAIEAGATFEKKKKLLKWPLITKLKGKTK